MGDALCVRDLMTREVLCVQPGDNLQEVYDLMADHHVRHIVVVDEDGDLRGLVSHRDLLRSSPIERLDLPLSLTRDILEEVRVQEVMTSEVQTAEPDLSLAEAARTMFDDKLGCLPVVEGSRLVGILTESDFVRHYARTAERQTPSGRLMAAR
jgi:CBS domain-containing protein